MGRYKKRNVEARAVLLGLLRERAGIFALPAAPASDVAAELRSITGTWVSSAAVGMMLSDVGCSTWQPAARKWSRRGSVAIPRPLYRCWDEAGARAMGSNPLWAKLMQLRGIHRLIDEARPVAVVKGKPQKRPPRRKPKLTAVARMYLDAPS